MSYNIFNQAQIPLKLALLNICIFLDNKSPVTIAEAPFALAKASEVISIFKKQIHFEETFILPLVFDYEPSIWDIYKRQHKKLMKLATSLEGLMECFTTEKNKHHVLQSIVETFNEFVLMNYHHMDDEEEILNDILSRYYSDDFLRKVEQQLKMQSLLFVQNERAVYTTASAA